MPTREVLSYCRICTALCGMVLTIDEELGYTLWHEDSVVNYGDFVDARTRLDNNHLASWAFNLRVLAAGVKLGPVTVYSGVT